MNPPAHNSGLSVPDFAQQMRLLQEPTAYPHPVKSIHLVQTHVSCVFLTGEYVYKIKKPVDFGFLDYRTLEQRRHWCEQELRLNQRLCPDIYLEVVPITLEEGHLTVGGSGTPIEWAVRMRQLREEDMLPQRLQNAGIGPEQIARLAHRLAAFHNSAANSDAIRTYGAPAVIADTIAVTLKTMDEVSATTLSASARADLRCYLEAFVDAHHALLSERVEETRIRDCHGDLRTQNICLDTRYDDGIQIFDCIEFNDAFRYIDVAADIAYLAMDLDLVGRADLRADLLDAYTHETQDRSLAQILPFYLVYRAIVRGNIALLAGRESEIPAPERQAQRDLAATAYDLAYSYVHRHPQPALLITIGFSGSGKSVLAGELVRRLPSVSLSSDRVRKERAGVAADAPLEAWQYSSEQRAEVYRILRERAGDYLVRGLHVLLDATFLAPQERQAAARLAQFHNAEFWMLECQAPDALIRRRLHARQTDPNASDADLQIYEQQRRTYSDPVLLPSPSTAGHHLIVDTSRPVAETAHDIVERFAVSSTPQE